MKRGKLVVIRGGGDIATGIACRLKACGFRVIMLEIEKPTVIRHTVAFAQCLFTATAVEGIKSRPAVTAAAALADADNGIVPVLVDPTGQSIRELRPDIVVDAILAKKNCGTFREMAPIVIAVGPGFTAGVDAHAVVESQRGHYLGKVYYRGEALPNTGVPGEVGGKSGERIIRANAAGYFTPQAQIGDVVKVGDIVGEIEGTLVFAPLSGILRGLINEGIHVHTGMKIGDVDPRPVKDHCLTVSDKARAVGGGVLEAILALAVD